MSAGCGDLVQRVGRNKPKRIAPSGPGLFDSAMGSKPAQPGDCALRSSISPVEQPSRDDLGLNLGRALEDREDTRVAEDARVRIFQRKSIAAMDLQAAIAALLRVGAHEGQLKQATSRPASRVACGRVAAVRPR